MKRLYPFIFVILWSSAFIAAKYGVMDAAAFSFLLTRFIIVTVIFAILAFVMKNNWPSRGQLPTILLAGVLMHGVYLGGVFYAIDAGMPAGVAAIISALQPPLTAIFALIFLNERVRPIQWGGIVIGGIGVITVVAPKIGGDIPIIGMITAFIGVCAIVCGTIIQKKKVTNAELVPSNALQAAAAAGFYAMLTLTIQPYELQWSLPVSLAMAWIVIAVSIGAVTILMLMIRAGQMTKTASIFYMVPATSAIMAYIFLGEELSMVAIIGLIIVSIGVWMVNRPQN